MPTLTNIPILQGWVNLAEAAEMLGISRQHAYKMARLTDEGKSGGWATIHRIGTKPMHVVALSEVLERQQEKNLHPIASTSEVDPFEIFEYPPESIAQTIEVPVEQLKEECWVFFMFAGGPCPKEEFFEIWDSWAAGQRDIPLAVRACLHRLYAVEVGLESEFTSAERRARYEEQRAQFVGQIEDSECE